MKRTRKRKRSNKKRTRRNRDGGGFFSKSTGFHKYSYAQSMKPETGIVKCAQCGHNTFEKRKSMLRRGRFASFFGTEFLFDKSASILKCANCSHLEWFKQNVTKVEY